MFCTLYSCSFLGINVWTSTTFSNVTEWTNSQLKEKNWAGRGGGGGGGGGAGSDGCRWRIKLKHEAGTWKRSNVSRLTVLNTSILSYKLHFYWAALCHTICMSHRSQVSFAIVFLCVVLCVYYGTSNCYSTFVVIFSERYIQLNAPLMRSLFHLSVWDVRCVIPVS